MQCKVTQMRSNLIVVLVVSLIAVSGAFGNQELEWMVKTEQFFEMTKMRDTHKAGIAGLKAIISDPQIADGDRVNAVHKLTEVGLAADLLDPESASNIEGYLLGLSETKENSADERWITAIAQLSYWKLHVQNAIDRQDKVRD